MKKILFTALATFVILGCSSGDDMPCMTCGDSSSSLRYSSSSVAYTLTCAAVPSIGIVGTTIIPPIVTCDGTAISNGLNWTKAPNWNNPTIGTYSSISVSASSGKCSGKSATCSGTLIVNAAPSADELTCIGMPTTGFPGTAITQPTVRCGTNTVTTGITWSNAPDWSYPDADIYNVSVRANCGGSSKTASCGKLTIASVLTCASVPSSGTAGKAITHPKVTCNGVKIDDYYLDWTNAPDWDYPEVGTYSGISVEAYYGNCYGETATCSGKLTVKLSSNSAVVSSSSSTPSSSSSVKSSSSSSGGGNTQSSCPNAVTGDNTVSCGGQTYRTTRIDKQIWMAENLNYDASGSKCNDNKAANCATYGRLYNWATAMALDASCNSSYCASQISAKHRGICPDGWHIPSDEEWTTLIDYVGSSAGKKLKATSGWNSNGNGTDIYGFAALPGGDGSSDGDFYYVGYRGFWRSATEYDAYYAYNRYMRDDYEDVYRDNYDKGSLQSVRCLQD